MEQMIRIPREEYKERWAAVRSVMKENDLDVILAYSDDRATHGNAYARYYSDLPTHFEPVIVMFVQDAAPVLLTGPETDGYAQEVGVIQDLKVLQEMAPEDEDYPFSVIEPFAKVLADLVPHKINKIGLAGKVYMGAELYESIMKACDGIEIVDADRLIGSLRGIKSPAEISVIRRAYEITNIGMKAAIDAIKPGVTERAVAAEAEYAMRKAGAEGYGIDTMIASGPNTKHIISRTTNRVIQENDVVVITVAPRYEGYHGACGRPVFLGTPNEKDWEAAVAMEKAQNLCASNLLVGNVGCEVEALGREVMKEAGYEKNFMYSGLHSIGVIEFEPPILGPSSNTIIEKDMVISIDIPLYEADINGMRMEDGYLITENGPERLTDAPWLIRK